MALSRYSHLHGSMTLTKSSKLQARGLALRTSTTQGYLSPQYKSCIDTCEFNSDAEFSVFYSRRWLRGQSATGERGSYVWYVGLTSTTYESAIIY